MQMQDAFGESLRQVGAPLRSYSFGDFNIRIACCLLTVRRSVEHYALEGAIRLEQAP
jgi:hypothetical protein